VYVGSSGLGIISKIIAAGSIPYWASFTSGNYPYSSIIDQSGNLYTINRRTNYGKNTVTNTVSKINSAGIVIESWAILDSLADPKGIVMDKQGNIYTCNFGNNTVSKIIPPTPTPLTLGSFDAFKQKETVNLKWQTSTEINTSHFIIQHSKDGTSFTDIGNLKAIGSGANDYSFMDNYPTNGINYYRLKSVDKDGSFAYSKIVSVQFTVNSNQLSVYPNPSKDKVTVRGNHIASIQVVDNMGKILKTQIVKDATNPTLSVGSLPVGVYHLRIQTTDGKVSGVGFVKE
jgi:hypothetical protein